MRCFQLCDVIFELVNPVSDIDEAVHDSGCKPFDEFVCLVERDGARSGKPTRERGRLFFVDFGSATASFLLSAVDFEAERDLRLRMGIGSATASLARSADFDAARDRLRAGFALEPRSTSTGVGAAVGVTAESAAAFAFRPSPRVFANVERRSE